MQTLSSTKTQSWLVWFLRGIVIVGFLVLAGRLIDLQVIRGSYFRKLSEENRIRRVPISAPRGKILARGGEILAGNREIQKEVIFDSQAGYEKRLIDTEKSTNTLITEWQRTYPEAKVVAHVTGYLGEVSEEELGKVDPECPDKGPKKLGDLIGRGGLEEKYDCVLRGKDGEELIEVDARGNFVRVLGKRNPIPGADIHTTIDLGLQKKVADLMEGKIGAVIVTDARGEILAFYSSPSFDPEVFVDNAKKDLVNKILKDKNLPLFNRVIGGRYHPGSTFKPIVAIAALEEGTIDKDFTYEDKGFISIKSIYGNFTFNNWYYTQYGGREGVIDLKHAIKRSTDTFFYKVGELLGVEKLADWAHKFSLDEKTGIDIPGEVAGLMPNPLWKIKVKKERWFLGDTYNISIGQGDVALTPLAINLALASIANEGKYCKPHLLMRVGIDSSKGKENPSCQNLGVKKENVELVKEGMVGACSPGGTGFTFFDFKEKAGIEVGCKTGTAEVDAATKDTHAWFSAFAPKDNPEIIATVLVERGGEGSKVAGPIARQIFDYFFKQEASFRQTPTPKQ